MGKVFPMRMSRKLKPQHRPPCEPDMQRVARIDRDRREHERIEADRAKRVAARRAAASALQATEASTNGRPLEDWSDRDAAWFVAHPERKHRVRRAVESELMPSGERSRWVAIRQIAPGVRLRLPFNVPYAQQRRLVERTAGEAGAALLFEMMACELGAGSILAAFEEAPPLPTEDA
jgi:hypothetical protein